MGADRIFGMHGTALQLRSQRLSMLASNIANAATPGYKARDLDFDKAMQRVQGGDSLDAALGTNAGYRVPLQPSMDGNTVELSTEQTLFAENAIGYSTTLSFLEGRVATLTRAIKGE
ncbi:flagellar basal body rod protein FlgB [Blastomonas aquatica]|uniref:Flagellar basal body rod protein FlgB n=1 Tax=Blastomonas aquatica TaxID=1510276 RepID=A0ABQ1IU24_9SPHN|nr:flagellar basal body rod protein FlgB [Blastomonas aquatica]GGB52469.1 flagellar basal body rod protein FlgB [Blastomonas aquatica]